MKIIFSCLLVIGFYCQLFCMGIGYILWDSNAESKIFISNNENKELTLKENKFIKFRTFWFSFTKRCFKLAENFFCFKGFYFLVQPTDTRLESLWLVSEVLTSTIL
jgi:hypothetical protein